MKHSIYFSIFVAMLTFSSAAEAGSLFGLREGQKVSVKPCASWLKLLTRPKALGHEVSVRASALNEVARFRIFNFIRGGHEESSRMSLKLIAAKPQFRMKNNFESELHRLLARQKKIGAPFDFIEVARNYVGIQSAEDFVKIIDETLDYFEDVKKVKAILPFDYGEKLRGMMVDQAAINGLIASQFLYRAEVSRYEFLFKDERKDRFDGGPSRLCDWTSKKIRVATRSVARIPYFLFPAAVLWHRELVELMDKNESNIALWLSSESPWLVQYEPGIAKLLKQKVRDAMIEHSLLLKLVGLYREMREIPELVPFRVQQLEEWASFSDYMASQQIAKVVLDDYEISSDSLDLGSFNMDLETIVEDLDGITLARIKSEQAGRLGRVRMARQSR